MEFNCSSRSIRGGARLGVLGAAFILLFSPVRAWPWGCEGHQAVAMIAEKHMSAHALEMANKLLQSAPIDPALSRYCSSQGLDLMADSAMLSAAKADFDATAEISKAALARLQEKVPESDLGAHRHGGCGCA